MKSLAICEEQSQMFNNAEEIRVHIRSGLVNHRKKACILFGIHQEHT